MDDLEREVGIGRAELISMAYVLGSDYTEGVKGVGIVNASEIISAFVKTPVLSPGVSESVESDEEELWGSGNVASAQKKKAEIPGERDIAAMCDRVLKGLSGLKNWIDGYARSTIIAEMAKTGGNDSSNEDSVTAPKRSDILVKMKCVFYSLPSFYALGGIR